MDVLRYYVQQSFNVKQNKQIYSGVWESVGVILHSEWPKLHRALASRVGYGWVDVLRYYVQQSFNVKQNKLIYSGVWESVGVILHSEWPKLHRALASRVGYGWMDV